MRAVAWAVLWYGVHQCMSSVLGMEKETPRSLPLPAICVNVFCKRQMLPGWDSEATVIEKSST